MVIDYRDQSDIRDTNGVNTETMEDQEAEPQEQMEMRDAEMREPPAPVNSLLQSSQDRFDLLRIGRDLLSHSTPSPPPRPSAPRDNPLSMLNVLADVAVSAMNDTTAPLDMTTSRSPAIMTSPPLTTHRNIRPAPEPRVTSSHPLQLAAGQPYSPATLMVIQSNGEPRPLTNGGPGHVSHVPSGLIQLPQIQLFSRIRLPASTSIGLVRWF